MHFIKNIKLFFVIIILTITFSIKEVKAQPCMAPAGGSFDTYARQAGVLLQQIIKTRLSIQTFYQMMEEALERAMNQVISDVTRLGQEFKEQFMDFDLRPAMQSMTAELHTATTNASKSQGGCIDAQELTKTSLKIKAAEVEAQRKSRPSVLQCQAATITGGLYRQDTIKEAYARAAPIQTAALSGASVGTAAADGEEVYLNSMWNKYCTRYVDGQSNNGITGCPTPAVSGTNVGEDINASNLFKDTYDVTDVELKNNVDDFIRNICGVIPIQRVQAEVITNTKKGLEIFIDGMSRIAQEQLCYTALYHIQSKRVPGSHMYNEILPHAAKAGIDVSSLPANPSWTTIEDIVEASVAADFQTQLIDEPEAVEKFLVVPDLYARTFGVNEIKDMQERSNAILAVLGARELRFSDNERTYDVKPR